MKRTGLEIPESQEVHYAKSTKVLLGKRPVLAFVAGTLRTSVSVSGYGVGKK
jgi:hypothetical protein